MPGAKGFKIPDPRPGHGKIFIPDPRPGQSDPEARRERKEWEKESRFDWKPILLVGLIGTTLWGGFNKSLSKCQEKHEEEERQEEERRRRQEEHDGSRDRGRGRYDPGRERRSYYDGYEDREMERRRRRRSEGPRYHDREWEERSRRGSSRPVSHVDAPRRETGREHYDRYQYYYDPRYDPEYDFERPRGRIHRERMGRRDSSW